MLHTLYSISEVLAFNQSKGRNYNLFDSRTFESDKSMEDSIEEISGAFIYSYNQQIKSFLQSIIEKENYYKKNNRPTFIADEGILMKYLGLNINKVDEYQIGIGPVRLFAFTDCDGSDIEAVPYMILYSQSYNTIYKEQRKYITLLLNKKVINGIVKDNLVDYFLTDMISALLFTYMDVCLTKYNVPVNNVVNPKFTYESIVLGENCTPTDARFIYLYYRTAFEIMLSIFDTNKFRVFEDLVAYNIALPELFYDVEEERNIYDQIFEVAHTRATRGTKEDNDTLIDLCSKIYTYLVPYVDEEVWSFTQDSSGYEDYYDESYMEEEEDTNAEPEC